MQLLTVAAINRGRVFDWIFQAKDRAKYAPSLQPTSVRHLKKNTHGVLLTKLGHYGPNSSWVVYFARYLSRRSRAIEDGMTVRYAYPLRMAYHRDP